MNSALGVLLNYKTQSQKSFNGIGCTDFKNCQQMGLATHAWPTSPGFALYASFLSSDRPANAFGNFKRIGQADPPIVLLVYPLELVVYPQSLNLNVHCQPFKLYSLFESLDVFNSFASNSTSLMCGSNPASGDE